MKGYQRNTRHFKVDPCFKRIRTISVAAALLMFFAAAGVIRGANGEPAFDKSRQEAVIKEITAKLNEIYVFPDTAKKMEKHLHKKFKQGAYRSITDPAKFAEILTQDLRDICHDLHLRVLYFKEPPRQRPDSPPDPAETSRRVNFVNSRFEKLERLPGNVGYLKFNAFIPAEYGGPTAVAALNFLANCDALIIDLRENGGGSPSMIQLICSYFFDEPVHLNSFYIRKGDKTKQFWTFAHIPGKRMTGVDLYVLTSHRTFSAAEEFTYNLKNMERATIVGETTGGGAHPVEFHYLEGLQFGVRIPFGRAVNPITGTNWEGTGIKPHVEVPKEEAFDKAYQLSLKKLAEKAENPEKKKAIENDINYDGYRRLNAGDTKAAIKTFKMNADLFPDSANVYDSLGEAYMKDNQTEPAIKNYRKSLEINPDNTNAVNMLKKLESADSKESN